MDSTTSIFQGTGFAMAAHSDRGLVRDVNEDAVLAVPEHRVMVVCDGLGGHAGGEVASGIAAEVVAEQFAEIPAPDRGSQRQMLRHVKDAIFLANHCILRRVWSEPELEGMGTTLCLAAFLDALHHLVLPAVALALSGIAELRSRASTMVDEVNFND